MTGGEDYFEHQRRLWDELTSIDPLLTVLAGAKNKGEWDLAEFMATGRAEVNGVLNQARELGIAPAGGSALDFGCAVGRLTSALSEHFERAVGVDVSPAMVEMASKLNLGNARCEFVLNPGDRLFAFGDGTFDMVYSSLTLMHIRPEFVRGYLGEFMRVLKPGGLLVFQEVTHHPRARYALKRLAPSPVLRVYRRLRFGDQSLPEMHPVELKRIKAWINEVGGLLIDARPSRFAVLRPWGSFRFYVRHPETR